MLLVTRLLTCHYQTDVSVIPLVLAMFLVALLVTFTTLLLARVMACEGRRKEKGRWGREDHFLVSNNLK